MPVVDRRQIRAFPFTLIKKLLSRQIMNQERVYYRFVNLSDGPASVYWMSHRTKRKLYCTLNPKQFIDVNTFSGHCWIFEDANTGDCLLADGTCIFTPTKWREFLMQSIMKNQTRLPRKVLTISRPCHTLKGSSYQAVCDRNISIKEAEQLLIPRELKDELLHLLKRKDCITRHSNSCENCPFDLHKAHFHHKCNMSACLSLLKVNSSGRLVRLPHGRLTCIPGTPKS
uniref:Protein Vhl n=2 Tax=Lygus hesperus TaxID=30085 RepID=A0A0A9Z2N3_LYGHE